MTNAEDLQSATRARALPDFDWQTGIKAIARQHKVTLEQLKGKSRFRVLVEARRECFRYLRDRGWSTPQIGKFFNRVHTTVIYGLLDNDTRERVCAEKNVRMKLIRAAGDR